MFNVQTIQTIPTIDSVVQTFHVKRKGTSTAFTFITKTSEVNAVPYAVYASPGRPACTKSALNDIYRALKDKVNGAFRDAIHLEVVCANEEEYAKSAADPLYFPKYDECSGQEEDVRKANRNKRPTLNNMGSEDEASKALSQKWDNVAL